MTPEDQDQNNDLTGDNTQASDQEIGNFGNQ